LFGGGTQPRCIILQNLHVLGLLPPLAQPPRLLAVAQGDDLRIARRAACGHRPSPAGERVTSDSSSSLAAACPSRSAGRRPFFGSAGVTITGTSTSGFSGRL